MSAIDSPEEAVQVLLKRIPSFAAARSQDEAYISHDDDGAYLVYGDFARFLTELILGWSQASEDRADVLEESFELLSELATSPNDEIANIAIVGVFEVLADCPDCVVLAERMLSKDAAKVLKRVMRGWI